ncbi:CBL-interacting serine threonine-protein kinase 11 [Musa troglodytarum]|uniref:CBL-interacting serine threonine-protein kinase 11 n=1 Tax=Musa troglodytarum TaxID=320322 RepID=A0A9E7KMJ7_9LILI|nr:CBL-interacting serine threonine-protein kinase 11 [Musa troglodytarum]
MGTVRRFHGNVLQSKRNTPTQRDGVFHGRSLHRQLSFTVISTERSLHATYDCDFREEPLVMHARWNSKARWHFPEEQDVQIQVSPMAEATTDLHSSTDTTARNDGSCAEVRRVCEKKTGVD